MRSPLAACLALVVLLTGCGGGGGRSPSSTAVAAATPAPAPVLSAPVPDEADEAGIMAFHARMLAVEVGLDADGEARVAAILERAWSDARAQVQGRVDACLPVDEEAVSDLLLTRQRAADLEIAALLTPAQRARFEELGGRLGADDQAVADAGATARDGGAR